MVKKAHELFLSVKGDFFGEPAAKVNRKEDWTAAFFAVWLRDHPVRVLPSGELLSSDADDLHLYVVFADGMSIELCRHLNCLGVASHE